MQPILQHLVNLQAVDLRLIDVRARLAAFPKQLAEVDARVAAVRAQLDAAKAAHLTALKDRKKYELDVEQWKEKVGKYKDQMFQVKTNEAYKALQHEVQTAEQEIAKAEDRLLEQMVSAEEYDRRVKSSEKAVKEVEEAMRAERLKVEAEKAAAEAELAELKRPSRAGHGGYSRKICSTTTNASRKSTTESLWPKPATKSAAACGMRVRPHVFQEMRRSDNNEIFHCETCTRILYYVEPAASAATASPQGDAVPNET